jgi:hypothetical protein
MDSEEFYTRARVVDDGFEDDDNSLSAGSDAVLDCQLARCSPAQQICFAGEGA